MAPMAPIMLNVGDLPPDYDPKTHCSVCENPLGSRAAIAYICEEHGTKQCSWLCRVTWLQILAKAKESN